MYELKVPMLKDAEIELLDQSLKAKEPLAKALNIFQGDNKCFLGTESPILIGQKQSLEDMKRYNALKHANTLVDDMLAGLKKFFIAFS
ncbi:hypothetical protein QYM36_013620 [Artemia franciscana]|uniref:Uncharacterized protein n=1 Tax=Artemia franciscana TaxID=6661 RepID=A0AA88HES4_ARTSF|nr:hypothetical protein QYM36_013620 [Artemia franciscana]